MSSNTDSVTKYLRSVLGNPAHELPALRLGLTIALNHPEYAKVLAARCDREAVEILAQEVREGIGTPGPWIQQEEWDRLAAYFVSANPIEGTLDENGGVAT